MVLDFHDFVPEINRKTLLAVNYESLRDTLSRANAWIEQTGIEVVAVETLLLPSVEYTGQTEFARAFTGSSTEWRQVIRVWFWRERPQ